MSDPDEASPPRFPFVGAVFCAACVGVATWLFFRWSYAWDVTPEELDEWRSRGGEAGSPSPRPDSRWFEDGTWEIVKWLPGDVHNSFLNNPFLGRYVRVRGGDTGASTLITAAGVIVLRDPSAPAHRAFVHLGGDAADGARDARAFSGRVVVTLQMKGQLRGCYLVVDTTRSRWTGESVAGLAVGAMGVVIFSMTFRHWLAQWRRFRGSIDAAEAGT